jgi:hypothetical protein
MVPQILIFEVELAASRRHFCWCLQKSANQKFRHGNLAEDSLSETNPQRSRANKPRTLRATGEWKITRDLGHESTSAVGIPKIPQVDGDKTSMRVPSMHLCGIVR